MSRKPRIVLPGYLYHVTQRGNNRGYIFADDNDFILYLKRIEEYRQKCKVEIYAYCLMGNHVHFILKPLERDSLSRLFSIVHMRYAQYYKGKYNASGHVWQGRFFSCMLDGEHLKQAIRYVEYNPVRARMVKMGWDYPWSSARAHLGKNYKWITLADINAVIDVESWREYLMQGEDEGFVRALREFTSKSYILGAKDFILKIQEQIGKVIIRNVRGRPSKNTEK
ncbi:MAG: transposase [Candidatus Omnitrophica bacterium]|nr:transposase [Candidatus Omnitrophota bacterium]